MSVDDRVEPLAREALTAVVKRDPDRLDRAFAAFSGEGEEAARAGVRLAMSVALYVLHDQYGGMPPEADLRAVAGKVAEMERWSQVTSDEVVAILTAAAEGTPGDEVLPMERVVVLPFIIAGNFLSGFRRPDENWWDYLDRAEAAIESS